jgi:uncharacterized protein YxjI
MNSRRGKLDAEHFGEVIHDIGLLSGKYRGTTIEGMFLSIVHDMAIHFRRGNGKQVMILNKEILSLMKRLNANLRGKKI